MSEDCGRAECGQGTPQSEKNRQKGARNERQAASILTRAGWKAVRVERAGTNNDPFRFVDVLGMPQSGSSEPVKAVQVKTNSFPAKQRAKYAARARIRDAEHVDLEVWVREDRVGWHVYEFDGEEWTETLAVESCDEGEAADAYRSHNEQPTLVTDGGEDCGRGTSRGRVLDLFCGVGGAARSFQRLGYEVVGFDIEPQPKYPGEFHQRDLRKGLPAWVLNEQWAGVWGSPICTPFTAIEAFQSGENLIPLARDLVMKVVPWAGFRIVENVPGASDHLRDPTRLQGGAFGLAVEKERVFETNFRTASQTVSAVSYAFCIGDREAPVEEYREAHGFAPDCDMTAKELREAIPPAYVRHLVEEYGRTGESRQEVLA